jgi:CRP/FNR family transcriptional regulator, cyclic AMP receptor protein
MITTVEKVLFLKGIGLFSAIPGEELAQIALITEEVHHGAGEVLISEGAVGESLYLVAEGRVAVLKGEHQVAELGEREVFGEMALLDPGPRSATVRALTDVTLLTIRGEDFGDIMAEKREIARAVIQVLTRRLRAATK